MIFSKGQTISKANYGVLNSPKKRTKLTILSKEEAQDSEFRSFFGRIEDTINCFRDLLTFSTSGNLDSKIATISKSFRIIQVLVIPKLPQYLFF